MKEPKGYIQWLGDRLSSLNKKETKLLKSKFDESMKEKCDHEGITANLIKTNSNLERKL